MLYKKYFFVTLLLLMGHPSAFAQFYPTLYRPSNQNWQQLSTDHFKILFPGGEDSVAWKTAHILEKEYPRVQKLTGGSLSNFPIILNDYTDRSNGFVTSLHFRSEIDISPGKGKTLNPKNGGWLENVVPHELTHAVQFSHLGGIGLGKIVNIFSPDLARSIHGASPSGIQEGLAVYFESNKVIPGGGRGNFPLFTNQFNSIFNSPARWSLGQMVQFPTYTRPLNRYYIGGYEFTQWLQNTYGWQTTRDAIDFHIRWPFLGYGLALKHATGQWPGQLYNSFEDKTEQKLPKISTSYTPLPFNADGAEIHNPKWLSDSTLIFFASFYNKPSGFYTYNINTHSFHQAVSTGVIQDYTYSISQTRDTLWYSYYKPDLIYPNVFEATLVEAKLTNGSTHILNPKKRLYAPTETTERFLALHPVHGHTGVVELNKKTNQLIKTLFIDYNYSLRSIKIDPHNSDSLAVIMNHHGNQSLWLTSIKTLQQDLHAPPTLSFSDGSIFDPAWQPDGGRLLFSADVSGTMQIYEYDLQSGHTTQITHAAYNAFEAAYNDDGNRIAFIIQHANNRLPVVISRKEFYAKNSNPAITKNNMPASSPGLKVAVNKDPSWKQSAYSTGISWLKPRAVLPTLDAISGSDQYQVGIGLHSNDLLQQQAYSAKVTTVEDRLWYDLSYQNKQFFPGFKAQFFSKPAFRHYRFVTQQKDTLAQSFLRQERSFALSFPMQFTFKQNVEFSGLYIRPEVRQSQMRFFNKNGTAASGFSNATIGNIFGQLNYRLQQNLRDIQPHRGFIFYSELEHYFASDDLILNTGGGSSTLKSTKPTALRGGLFGYLSPLGRWNQSLRLGFEALTQTAPVFDNQSIVSNGFTNDIYPFSHNLVNLNSRYTIPLFYPDDGGLLIPLYLSSVYISAFTNTIWDPGSKNPVSSSRTVVGGGLRIQFRISNLSFDIGAGIGWEPSRNNIHYIIGDF